MNAFTPYLLISEKKCKRCKKAVAIGDSYKVKRHFQSLHPEIVEILIAENERKLKLQPKINIAVGNTKQKAVENQLVNLFSSAPVAMALITNAHFQKLLSFFPDISPPKLNRLKTLMNERLNIIMNYVKNNCFTSRFSVTADGGTTKGMTNSFLAVSLSFVDRKRQALTCVPFELLKLDDSHTGVYLRGILEDALKRGGANFKFIVKIVTDGAANMSKAFFEPFEDTEEMDEEDRELQLQQYESFLAGEFGDDLDVFIELGELDIPHRFHCVCHRLELTQKEILESVELKKRCF